MRLAANPRVGNLLDWALHYGERGWPVLPLVPRSKRPLTASGLHDATSSRTQITQWWTRWPDANIGLRTGVQFDVLDVDGDAGLTSLATAMGPEFGHSGPISLTGRGQHWLFLPGGTANRTGLLNKVDWRGTNGYVVAPPSVHPEGHRYAWHPEHGPDTRLTDTPAWLTPLLLTHVERPADTFRIQGNQFARTTIVEIAEADGHRVYRGNKLHCIFDDHPDDDTASLHLYPDNNTFYCFGCGAWGDVQALIERRPRYRRAEGR